MWKKTVVITSGILLSEFIWQMYNAYKRKAASDAKESDKENEKPHKRKKIFEVMFFSKESALCRSHMEQSIPCMKKNCAVGYLRKLVHYLNSATETLDICMYLLTYPPLTKAIINAHKRGVTVRMVIDGSRAQGNDNQTNKYFYLNGIKPKMKELDTLMHHKFVIIDKNILITGSVNWTMSAFFGNFDSVFVTNEYAAVAPFVNEFERIWIMLDSMNS